MGIPGLTTFIENNAHLYLQNYELHDTSLVIDGCAVARLLYELCNSNMCFGDYDKYAKSIKDFFNTLSKCNVTPYVLFDGGNEFRKMETTVNRVRDRIKTAVELRSAGSRARLYPLFIRQTFYDIGFELGIKMVQCDFESDSEIANIARRLGCPVLSYDSDFYIFDGLYIPFKTLDLTVRRAVRLNTKSTYYYLECSLYTVDTFLNYHHLRSRNILPLFAVVLGNDYVNKNVSSMIHQKLGFQINHRGYGSPSHQRIRSALIWIQNETVDRAIIKILQKYPKNDRKEILDIINEASKGYNYFDSIYLKYLNISPPEIKSKQELMDLKKFNDMVAGPTECEENEQLHLGREMIDKDLSFSKTDENSVQLPSIFIKHFRTLLYPHYFMDIYLRHKYYCAAQVEDVASDSVYKVCFDIIGAIFKILTGLDQGLQCIGRVGKDAGTMEVPPYTELLPTLEDIQKINNEEKQKVFLKILKFDDTLKQCLNLFPSSWHIYVIAIMYIADKSKLPSPLKYSLILSKIILSYIDRKIGFIRSVKLLMEKYSTELNQPVKTKGMVTRPKSISECLGDISTSDSTHCMKSLLIYFDMHRQLACNSDRKLAHSISEFQTVLLHLKYLNNLLQRPFSDFNISDCLNCTFVYNFTANLNKQGNIKCFLDSLLCNSPNILRAVHSFINTLSEDRYSLLTLSKALDELEVQK